MSKVTVVIPFWDLGPELLRDCMESVRSQSEPCDILIVDNRSKTPVADQPGARVMRLARRVSVGEARTLGLQEVTTPYVMFMDADDKLLPGALAHLRHELDARPEAALVAGRIVDWVPWTGALRSKPWPSAIAHWLNAASACAFRLGNAVRNMTPVTGCAVMRTAMAKATRGFPDSTAEDWTFGVAMSFQGRLVLTTREVKLYRWRAQGLSKQALCDLRALLEARFATRSAIRAERKAPLWLKVLVPVIALLHLLELPFHVRREHVFSDAVAISNETRLVEIPTDSV